MTPIRSLPLLAVLALASLAGCASEHGHGHGSEAGHDHEVTTAAATPAPPAAPATEAVPFALGALSATLMPSAGSITLSVTAADGSPVTPAGQAMVVLTGTGQEEQRLTLEPQGGSWTGPAAAAGAPGYMAVVSVIVGGHTESGKASWGEVPAPAPAAEPAHDHGDGGHDHGEGGHGH